MYKNKKASLNSNSTSYENACHCVFSILTLYFICMSCFNGSYL